MNTMTTRETRAKAWVRAHQATATGVNQLTGPEIELISRAIGQGHVDIGQDDWAIAESIVLKTHQKFGLFKLTGRLKRLAPTS